MATHLSVCSRKSGRSIGAAGTRRSRTRGPVKKNVKEWKIKWTLVSIFQPLVCVTTFLQRKIQNKSMKRSHHQILIREASIKSLKRIWKGIGKRKKERKKERKKRANHAVEADEFLGRFGPGRQEDVVDGDVVLGAPHLVAVGVDQHLRQVKQFRNQLLFRIPHSAFRTDATSQKPKRNRLASNAAFFLTYSLTFFLWPSFSLSIDTFLPGLPFFFLVCFSSLIGRPLDWFWKWFYDGRVSFYFYVFFSAFFFLFGTFLCHPSFRRPFDFTLFGSSFFFVLLVVGCAFPFLFFFCFFFFIFLKKFSAPSAGWGPFFVRHPDRIWLIDLFVTHTTYRRWTFAFLFGCRRKDRECFTGFYRVFFLHLVDIAQSDSGSYRVFFLMWSLLTRHFLRRNRVYRVCTEFFHFV